jgi:hypothetical protein
LEFEKLLLSTNPKVWIKFIRGKRFLQGKQRVATPRRSFKRPEDSFGFLMRMKENTYTSKLPRNSIKTDIKNTVR